MNSAASTPQPNALIVPLPNVDDLINLKNVAKMLGGISVRSVRRLIARKILPRPVYILSIPMLYRSDLVCVLERMKSKR